jgi:hypothetical protein
MRPQSAVTSRSVPIGQLAFERLQRGEPRIAHRMPCRVLLTDPDTGSRVELCGETLNLSRRGLAVHVGREIPTGSTVEVLIEAPDGGPSCLIGAVIHSRRVLSGTYELGIGVTNEFRPLNA